MNYQHLKQLIEEHKVIHLCGIGGVSMRALARLLQQMGATVQGSDRDHSPAVAMLRRQGGVEEAAKAAAGGDTGQLMAMVNRLMSSKEGAELVARIENQARKAGLK